jgi:hypothetical protein
MSCSGECKIQIYDFDFSDLQVKPVSPADTKRYICYPPDAAQIEAAILESFASSIPPKWQDTSVGAVTCADIGGPNCVCIPREPDASQWSQWQRDTLQPTKVTSGKAVEDKKGAPTPTVSNVDCVYEVSGAYWISSAIALGNCQPKPVRRDRPRNPKRPKKDDKMARTQKIEEHVKGRDGG